MDIDLFDDYSAFDEVFETLIKVDESELTPEEGERIISHYLRNLKVNCMKVRMVRYQARLSLDDKRAYEAVVNLILNELAKIFKKVKHPPVDLSKKEEYEKLRRLIYKILNDLFQCVLMVAGSPKKLWEYVEDPLKRRMLDENCMWPVLINHIYPSYSDGFKRISLAIHLILAVIFYAPWKCLNDVKVHKVPLYELLPLLEATTSGS